MIGFIKKLLGSTQPDFKSLVREGAIMVDVRTPGEFSSGHAKGSVNIPLDKIHQVVKKYKKEDVIIVCCRSGMRSRNAQAQMRKLGYTQVHNAGAWQNLMNM